MLAFEQQAAWTSVIAVMGVAAAAAAAAVEEEAVIAIAVGIK
jgi:hypothetical protein